VQDWTWRGFGGRGWGDLRCQATATREDGSARPEQGR
jgi:hypothetical protein